MTLGALVLVSVVAVAGVYAATAPAYAFAAGVLGLLGCVLGFVVVWRKPPGPRSAVAAVLILADLVAALRAFTVPYS